MTEKPNLPKEILAVLKKHAELPHEALMDKENRLMAVTKDVCECLEILKNK